MVSFSAVAKRYPGGQEALRDVSFSLDAGGEALSVSGLPAGWTLRVEDATPAVIRFRCVTCAAVARPSTPR